MGAISKSELGGTSYFEYPHIYIILYIYVKYINMGVLKIRGPPEQILRSLPFSIPEGPGAHTVPMGKVWRGRVCRQVGPAGSAP